MEMSHPPLEECPQCGGKVVLIKSSNWSSYFCKCSQCGQSSILFPTVKSAVAGWNGTAVFYRKNPRLLRMMRGVKKNRGEERRDCDKTCNSAQKCC